MTYIIMADDSICTIPIQPTYSPQSHTKNKIDYSNNDYNEFDLSWDDDLGR